MTGGRRSATKRVPALLLLAAIAALGCRPRAASRAIARVAQLWGEAEVEAGGRWRPGEVGAELAEGNAIRTGADSKVRLVLASGRTVHLGEHSLLRFVRGSQPQAPRIGLDLGTIELEGEGGIALDTPGGPARVAPGTRMRVAVEPSRRARYEVLVGSVAVGEAAREVAVGAGQGLSLAVGGIEVERYGLDVGAMEIEKLHAPKARGADAGATARAPAPDPESAPVPADPMVPADVTVPAGESAILHGLPTPLLVRVRFAKPCPRQGALEIAAGESFQRPRLRASGHAVAVLALPAGQHRYRVTCAGVEQGSGLLVVRRDAGTSPVPRVAPVNIIEADGHKYTVLFQNRLPALTFTWPDAPQGRYTLHLQRGGQARVLPARKPELRLTSGAITEGEYQWWWSEASGRESARGTLVVLFDNASVTAQVDRPPNQARGSASGAATDQIEVAGLAIAGSTVAVSGAGPLPMDAQGRFRGLVRRPADGERAIAIRLEHPHSGVHYYVRRMAQPPPPARR